MKEHFSSRVTKLLVILALAIVASVMFVIVGCSEPEETHTVHTWVADTSREDVDATCTTTGVHYVICSECGMTSSETTPALGHEWANDGNMLRQEPTCTEDGYYYRECTREGCGYRETSTIIAKTGHKLNFADVTITAPTCTADGSISGACAACGETITISADDIKKDVNLIGYTDDAAQDKQDAANEDAEEGEEVDYHIGEKDGKSTFLQAFGHSWIADEKNQPAKVDANGDLAQPCVENKEATKKAQEINENDTQLYAGYCDRCGTLVPVAEHHKPAGAVVCIAAAKNENMSQADINAVAPENRNTCAFHCDVCDTDVKANENHNYQISTLVSGNPVLDPENAVFEVAEGVTKLDCHYYYVCKDCGDVSVTTPHTWPLATDTANAANCGHGAKCTVCGLEMSQPTDHTLTGKMYDADDETFGSFTYAAATCTQNEQKFDYCVYCKAREDAGEEVDWVLRTGTVKGNYKYADGYQPAYNHDDWQKNSYKKTAVALDGSALTNCVSGYQWQDICGRCGEPRVSVKPTFYSKSTVDGKDVYTEIKKEADFKSAQDGTGVYTLANDKYTKIDFTKDDSKLISWTTDRYDRPWTDADGLYGTKTYEHAFSILPMSQYPTDDLFEFNKDNKPFCNTVKNGVEALKICDNCGMYTWETISFDDFLAQVVGMNEDAYIASREDWHAGEHMLVCPHGNSQCDACQTGNHNAQYYINFEVVDGVKLAIPQQAFFACANDADNKGAFTAALKEFEDQYAGIYTFEYFTDKEMSSKLTDDWSAILHDEVDGKVCFDDATVYVKVTEMPTDEKNSYFYGAIDNLRWAAGEGEARDSLKGISFHFSESFIGHENISRIAITVTRTEGEGANAETITMGTAISTGDQLTALLASLTYPEADAESQMVEVNVGNFGYNEANGATPDGFWTMSNSNFRDDNNQLYELNDVTVTITMTTSTGLYQAELTA